MVAAIGAATIVLMILGSALWGFALPALFPDAPTTLSILAMTPDGSLAKAVIEPLLVFPVHGTAAGVVAVIVGRRPAAERIA